MGLLYRAVAQPLLFRLEPERSHESTAALLRWCGALPGGGALLATLFGFRSPRLASRVCGVEFPNPVGLGAGFDKTGALYPALARMGFGSVECGTFTAQPQAGNPRPRIFRLPAAEALVNRMGFNNPGAERAARILAPQARPVPRGVSVGKSRAAPLAEAAQDHRRSLELLAPLADYVALNLSSPNTPGLRDLQEGEGLRALLADARAAIAEAAPQRPPPLFVKLSPDLTDAALEAAVGAALDSGVAGLVLTNTTARQEGLREAAALEGGLSGRPLRERSTEVIRRARRASGGRLAIIGVGGVFSAADALEKLRAGANLIQIYTGYVYRGPGLPRAINRELDRWLRRERMELEALIGAEAPA